MIFSDLRAANIARDKEWNTGSERVSLSFRGNELAGEIGEACNVLKKLERERIGLVGSRATLDDLAEELSDGIICIDLIAMDTGIDLGPAVERKFNKTSVARGLATRLTTSAAIRDVVAERHRHVDKKGWTPAHDDEHDAGQMASAAAAYTLAATFPGRVDQWFKSFWPWERAWWKPGTARRMLVKAAALLIAEIERIDRRDGAPQ
ncbi:NTP pyrophosphatase (non-canonical NTP hydrolase) [Bosea sp. OAE752]|uniref:MazG-like family protein n=1 Tax=Bosea sp. OAE752 TaxID=2663873 RepID=UPI003D216E3F